MTPDLTVLSVFHNREDSVDLSMKSLAEQGGNFRAVIVDDGSSDATWPRLQRWSTDRITVRTQANRGFTATMISLCDEVDTSFIALLGAGDENLPGRLSRQVALLREHPDTVVCGCAVENVDATNKRRWVDQPELMLREGPITGDFGISHGEAMFRSDAYQLAGGYRTAFPVGQASDLFRRMSRFGSFEYIPDVLYRRHLRRDGVNANPDKVAERTILAAISESVHRRELVTNDIGTRSNFQDDLDRFGLLLPYLGPPDRRIARALALASTQYWAGGNKMMARRTAKRSLAEAWTLRGLLAWAGAIAGVGAPQLVLRSLRSRIFDRS